MSYVDLLRQKAKEFNSIVCFGIDPVLEQIPLRGKPHDIIVKYYLNILERMHEDDVYPAAVKPNSAYFEQYGIEGLQAIEELIDAFKSNGIPVIFDAKRGDIDRTSAAYAQAVFRNPGVSAVTVNPFMGKDSVQPFVQHCDAGKGVYLLCRTSNPGAADFQQLMIGDEPLFMKIARKIVEWWQPGVGAVVGAPNIAELQQIATFFCNSGRDIPLLIPGVGTQGGNPEKVRKALHTSGYDLSLVRVNAGSSVGFAQADGTDYAGAVVAALRELNTQFDLRHS